jgi:hypothetical protein
MRRKETFAGSPSACVMLIATKSSTDSGNEIQQRQIALQLGHLWSWLKKESSAYEVSATDGGGIQRRHRIWTNGAPNHAFVRVFPEAGDDAFDLANSRCRSSSNSTNARTLIGRNLAAGNTACIPPDGNDHSGNT